MEKTTENVKKHSDVKLVTEKTKKLFGVRTSLSYYKFFCKKFISNRNGKNEILMNKPVYLGLSILELSRILMYKFWYDYVKPKNDEKNLCYMDTDSSIV